MNELLPRRLLPEDAPAAAEVERVCFADPWSEAAMREELENPLSEIFGIDCPEGLAAIGGWQCVAGEGYVLNVAVRPEYRRRGLGGQLVELLKSRARQRKAAFLTLEVRAGNAPAIRLYEKLGFEEVGRRKNYYRNPDEDALLLTCQWVG